MKTTKTRIWIWMWRWMVAALIVGVAPIASAQQAEIVLSAEEADPAALPTTGEVLGEAEDPCGFEFSNEFSYPGGYVLGSGSEPSVIVDFEVFDDGSGPKLFMAGEFLAMGGMPGSAVAVWDGTLLRTLFGSSDPRRFATSLATFDDGTGSALYAAGKGMVFRVPGSHVCSGIARWDGEAWSADFLEGSPLLDHNGNPPFHIQFIHAFGEGENAALYFARGGETGIVRWDGQTWETLGNFHEEPRGRVIDIVAVDRGNGIEVFVAGENLELTGETDRFSVVHWDGTQWSPAETLLETPVTTLAVLHGPVIDIVLAGTPGGIMSINTLNLWSHFVRIPQLPTGEPAVVNDIMILGEGASREVWACGRFPDTSPFFAGDEAVIGRWKDQQWESFGSHETNDMFNRPIGHALEFFDNGNGESLFVGGAFNYLDSQLFDPFFDDTTLPPDEIRQIGGINARSIARWDGKKFQTLGKGLTTSVIDRINMAVLYDVVVHDDGGGPKLYVAGDVALRGGASDGVIRRVDGEWEYVREPLNGIVHSLASDSEQFEGDLFAAGSFQPELFSSDRETRVMRWGGVGWSTISPLTFDGDVRDLLIIGEGGRDALIAAGAFSQVGQQLASNLAVWNGSSWSEFAGGTDGAVSVLLVDGDGILGSAGGIVAGGEFTFAGNTLAPSIALWNGSSWSALADGLPGVVSSLAFFDDGGVVQLYAGGAFDLEEGTAPNIARWDGIAWNSLPLDRDLPVADVEVTALLKFTQLGQPLLAVGGPSFSTQNGQLIAWSGEQWFPFGSRRPFANRNLSCGTALRCGPRALVLMNEGDGQALWIAGRFMNADENNSGGIRPTGASSITTWSQRGLTRITQQPESARARVGGAVSFSIDVEDTGEQVWFQWFKDGEPLRDGKKISGTQTSTFTIDGVRKPDAGDYLCVVSTGCGDNESRSGQLEIFGGPRCLGDADSSGIVDFDDITSVLSHWGDGADGSRSAFDGDATGDGVVNFDDITSVLANFRRACEGR